MQSEKQCKQGSPEKQKSIVQGSKAIKHKVTLNSSSLNESRETLKPKVFSTKNQSSNNSNLYGFT